VLRTGANFAAPHNRGKHEITRELSVSEQHNMGLDAEGEVVDLEAVLTADNAEANPDMDSEEAEAVAEGEAPSKEAAKAQSGLEKLVEERLAQREDDNRDEESAEGETEEEQVAEAAAAGGGEAGETVQVADIINGLDGVSESFVRASEPLTGGANLLGDDNDGGSIILAIGAIGLAAAAIALVASGDDDDDLPPPPPANEDPVAGDDAAVVIEGETVIGDVSVNDTDADGDTLTYSLADDVDGLTLNSDGTFTFDASDDEYDDLADGETEDVTATINVSDGNGGTTTSTLTITVTGVNDPSVITSDAFFDVDENTAVGTVVFTAEATDIDTDDVVAFSLTGADADLFDIDPVTGEISVAGPIDFEDDDELDITLNATDLSGEVTSQDIVVTVNDVDDTPTRISLNVDSDGNLATLEPFSGDGGDIGFSDSADIASNVEITDFEVGDTISVDTDTSNFSFTTNNDGSSDDFDDLVIAFNNDGVLSQILIQDAVPAGSFVFDEASAEAAFGADFFFEGDAPPAPPPPPAPTTPGEDGAVSLDQDDDASVATGFRIDAGAGAFRFEDDSDTANSIILEDVSADDLIVFTNGDLDDYSFTTSGTDLIVTFNNDGVLNTVTLEDAVSEDDFVSDEASAEAALGNALNEGVPLDFFQDG
jgi:VCBS repeat-containing protein